MSIDFLLSLHLVWDIELDNKLTKTGCQLDEITAERPVFVEILAHAAMIASILANCIVHLDHCERGAVDAKVVLFTRPTLHPILLWKNLVAASHRVSRMLADPTPQHAEWVHLAGFLTHGGADRNWKINPSPIDDVKGRNASGKAWRDGQRRKPPPRRLK